MDSQRKNNLFLFLFFFPFQIIGSFYLLGNKMVVSMHQYFYSIAGRTNQHKLSDISSLSQGLFTAQSQVSAAVLLWAGSQNELISVNCWLDSVHLTPALLWLVGSGRSPSHLVDDFSPHSQPHAPSVSHQQTKGLRAFALGLSLSSTWGSVLPTLVSPFRHPQDSKESILRMLHNLSMLKIRNLNPIWKFIRSRI